jgi:hypothetical protein
MLNPGYTVIAKKKRREDPAETPGRSFICPACKKIFLEVAEEPVMFLTKCSHCKSWIYGEKKVANNLG